MPIDPGSPPKQSKINRINNWIAVFGKFSDRVWYKPVIAAIVGSDFFLIFIPVDAILVSMTMLKRSAWIKNALWVSSGSALGAGALAGSVHLFGEDRIARFVEANISQHTWHKTMEFLDHSGGWTIILSALGPMPHAAVVFISAVAKVSVYKIAVWTLIGRIPKYLLFSWLASHAPHYLKKFIKTK